MNFLERCRLEATDDGPQPLHHYERTRLATLVSWSSLAKASDLLGTSASTLERAMQGEPVQDRTVRKIVAGLDRLHDAIEPAVVRLARAVSS